MKALLRKARLQVRASLMTEAEYRANHNGLNIFFGAVLGFVLAGMEKADPVTFAWMLFMTSGTIISILYVSASKHRLVYLLLSSVLIYELPRWMKFIGHGDNFPQLLQPTLAVWLAITALVEFLPRERNGNASSEK